MDQHRNMGVKPFHWCGMLHSLMQRVSTIGKKAKIIEDAINEANLSKGHLFDEVYLRIDMLLDQHKSQGSP